MASFTALIYSNTLEAPYYLDDEVNIVENPFVRLTTLTPEKLIHAGIESPCPNRPVANISFGLNYWIHQYNVSGYHIVNIIVHIINGILLYFFIMTTLKINPNYWPYQHARHLAFFTALIWLVHPLQTQSVTYIVQRMNSMSAMFYLAALLSYVKGRRATENSRKWIWFLTCLVSWLLALGSKEIAASLPIILILYEWLFFQHCSVGWVRRHVWPLLGTVLALVFTVLVYTDFEPLRAILSGYAHRDFTVFERVLTQFRVMGFYVGLIMYPHPTRLSLLHDFDISRTLIDPPTTLFCLVAIAATLLGALWFTRKEPLLVFSVLWFFGNLAIESSVVSLEIIFEHRTYLPSMLAGLFIVTLLYRHTRKSALVTSLLLVVAVALSSWTYQRNTLWNDELAFWKDCTQKAHHDVRAHHSLGNAYLKKNRFDDSIKAYKQALTIAPHCVESLVGLGHALRETGNLDRAVTVHKRAIALAPKKGGNYNQLGADYLEQNRLDLAVEALEEAIALAPLSYRAYNNLGLVQARMGKESEAVRMYERAIAIRPDFASAYNNLGTLYLNPRESQKAIGFFQKAITLDSRSADAHSNLGLALLFGRKLKEGVRHMELALQLEPNHQDAMFNLARTYELTGNYEQSIQMYQKIIRQNPMDVEARFNAGFIYMNHLASNEQAIMLFKQGLSVNPSHQEAKAVREILFKLENTVTKDA